MTDAYYIPPSDTPIGPCRHCPGDCPIEDHIEETDDAEATCEQHPTCPGFTEFTYEDHLADEADRAYSLHKEGA